MCSGPRHGVDRPGRCARISLSLGGFLVETDMGRGSHHDSDRRLQLHTLSDSHDRNHPSTIAALSIPEPNMRADQENDAHIEGFPGPSHLDDDGFRGTTEAFHTAPAHQSDEVLL